jgi:hypothetical protein
MSGTELLDLMRNGAEIQFVDIDAGLSQGKDGKKSATPAAPRPINKNPAIAFSISFEYENPELAMKVANEFLTMILNEMLARELIVQRRQLLFLLKKSKGCKVDICDLKLARDCLFPILRKSDAMKADLIQKVSVYSEAHPAVKTLFKVTNDGGSSSRYR